MALLLIGCGADDRPASTTRARETSATQGHLVIDPAEGDRLAADLGAPAAGDRPEGGQVAAPPVPSATSDDIRALPVSDPLEAAPAAAVPAIGAMVHVGDGGPENFCTASVVHSPNRNLVATAAHCVYSDDFSVGVAFAPGYTHGEMPYGVWVPSRIDVDPRWVADRDPDFDVAFLQVRSPGTDDRIEDVTGAEQIRFDFPAEQSALLVGYPEDQHEPIDCRNRTSAFGDTQLRFDCANFPDGTSGGPMITDIDPANGRGTLIGVIGGYQLGGDELTSYSSYFGAGISALYERACAA
ncbi:serine protease [Streptomyces sp. SID3343]|uniref:trypsin-like serine peptidase n=1 Tax=Streptomyces sp. SID3343 TaxID=2690260 RepID=UPI0031F72DE4